MELLRSKLIGVPHGFPTREGGVSRGAFGSLNAGLNTGDAAEAVEENLRRVAAAAGVEPGALWTVSQVHGIAVLEAGAGQGRTVPPPRGEADALWTERRGAAVGVKTADCVPVLLEDPVGRRVAAAHAGWRGTVDGVVEAALAALVARGTRASDVRAAIGPHIRACCFEVGDEVVDRFRSRFGPPPLVLHQGRKPHVSLAVSLELALEQAGVRQVDVLEACTSCDARFFSHRRDKGVTGRHLSFITCAFGDTATRL